MTVGSDKIKTIKITYMYDSGGKTVGNIRLEKETLYIEYIDKEGNIKQFIAR
jgi:hypothetical protein